MRRGDDASHRDRRLEGRRESFHGQTTVAYKKGAALRKN